MLSDAAYTMTVQEAKEHEMPTIMPYYKTRALAKLLGVSLLQTKERLIREVDSKMFFEDSITKPAHKDLQKHYETESFSHQRLTAEPESNAASDDAKGLAAVFPEGWYTQDKRLAPDELYKVLGNFVQPSMVFANHMRNPSSSNPKLLTPILYCPYTISTMASLSDHVVLSLARHLGLFTQSVLDAQL